MKNLRQSITFRDYMVKLCLSTLSTLLSSSNLYSVYLSFGISYGIADNFSIHSFALYNNNFLMMGFINGLEKNLSTLYFVVSDSAK